MSSYVHRAFCAYAAAAAVSIVPLTSSGQDVPVHHSAQAGLAQAPPMPPTASAPYGYHHIPSDPAAAPPPPPVHSHHGYGTHDPSIPQNSHDGVNMGTLPNPYTLWEQSSGTTELSTHSWKPPLSQENLSMFESQSKAYVFTGALCRVHLRERMSALKIMRATVLFALLAVGKLRFLGCRDVNCSIGRPHRANARRGQQNRPVLAPQCNFRCLL